ncbi:MAG TPA: hypothetical protein VGM05_22085 [Planctomycetaceae bacterium]|jgi:hypothetical protein
MEATIKKPAKSGAKLRSQTGGEQITYAPVETVSRTGERYSRLVCSPAWGMGRDYPPRASSPRTAMCACGGKVCAPGRLYPWYYRTVRERGVWLCYDCWQNVLLMRRRELESWYSAEWLAIRDLLRTLPVEQWAARPEFRDVAVMTLARGVMAWILWDEEYDGDEPGPDSDSSASGVAIEALGNRVDHADVRPAAGGYGVVARLADVEICENPVD